MFSLICPFFYCVLNSIRIKWLKDIEVMVTGFHEVIAVGSNVYALVNINNWTIRVGWTLGTVLFKRTSVVVGSEFYILNILPLLWTDILWWSQPYLCICWRIFEFTENEHIANQKEANRWYCWYRRVWSMTLYQFRIVTIVMSNMMI